MAKMSKFELPGGSGGSFDLSSIFSGGALNGMLKNISLGGIGGLLSSITGAGEGGGTNQIVNYRYRYNVTKFQVIFPGEEPKDLVPEAMKTIWLTYLYDECLHPIFEAAVMLPQDVYAKIIKNKNEVEFIIRIQMTSFDSTNRKVQSLDFINDKFGINTDDEFEYKDEPIDKDVKKTNHGGSTMAEYDTEFLLTFWKQHDLEAMREIKNDIFNDVTISTVLTKVFTESGFKNILISPMDNQKSYQQLVLVPNNLMNVPDYLEKAYGTYYTGTRLFADFNRTYILSKNGICDAFEEMEYRRVIFIVRKANEPDSRKAGTSEDSQNRVYYIYVENDNVSVEKPSTTNDLIEGNNITVINPSSNQTMDIEKAGQQKGGGSPRLVTDGYGNDYAKSTILSDINEGNRTLTITATDFRAEAFTPNKEFLLVFEDTNKQENNGFYRIISSEMTLTKEDNDLNAVGVHRFVYKRPLTSEESQQIITAITPKSSMSGMNSGMSSSIERGQTSVQPPTMNPNTTTSYESGRCPDPSPRNSGLDDNHVVKAVECTDTPITQDPNYNYDNLGNLKGMNVPEYNMIQEDDSNAVIEAKKKAQQDMLPCPAPKPKDLVA